MSVIKTHKEIGCEDCGFYQDCPENYKCPALEILSNMLENPENKAIIKLNDSIFIRLPFKNLEEEDE